MADVNKAIEYVLGWEQEYESSSGKEADPFVPILCSRCFSDEGLRLVSEVFGFKMEVACPNCGSALGAKLDLVAIRRVMQKYFNTGTMHHVEYGSAPVLASNSKRPTSVRLASWANGDLALITEKAGWGVFEYGPPLWMVGMVGPLMRLIAEETRREIIDRITSEYPARDVVADDHFYRMRRNVANPTSELEFDSPPEEFCGGGRLDSGDFPVLYGSQDMQVCVHECRTTVDDETYVATIAPTRTLRLLDLSPVLEEADGAVHFESLDLTVHMLFLAKSHSYEITRHLARAAKEAGYDGIIFPSYFSLLRTGARPLETIYGISVRNFEGLKGYASSQIIPNVAIFGRPVKEGAVKVKSINSLYVDIRSCWLREC